MSKIHTIDTVHIFPTVWMPVAPSQSLRNWGTCPLPTVVVPVDGSSQERVPAGATRGVEWRYSLARFDHARWSSIISVTTEDAAAVVDTRALAQQVRALRSHAIADWQHGD